MSDDRINRVLRSPPFDSVLSIVTAIATIIATVAALSQIIWKSTVDNSPQTLEARIEKLTGSLNGAAKTISEIEAQIEQRRALVDQLKEDARTAQALSAVGIEQTAAIAQSLRAQLQRNEREGFWWSFGQNFFFAALGVALSEGYGAFRRRRKRKQALLDGLSDQA